MRVRVVERHWSKQVFLGVLALVLGAIFPARTGAQSAVRHTLTWDASMEAAEYRVERDFVFVGSTTQLTFPVSILPGETVTFGVRSFGWCQDIITGDFFGCEGPLSTLVFHTEPLVQPPPTQSTSSADTTICRVGTGCSLIDAGLNLWTLDDNWVIRRNGQHWNVGYSDWLLSFGGKIYAYRSDISQWWVDTPSGWEWVKNDSRTPPAPSWKSTRD